MVIAIASIAGCRHDVTGKISNPSPIDHSEFTRMYKAALRALRQYGFRIDRHSHRYGTITTKDLMSPTIFEPWHTTNSTDDQAWASTFNQQRRRVVVCLEPLNATFASTVKTLTPTEPTNQFGLRVEVLVEQVERPNRYLTGSTTGHGVYGSLKTSPGEWRERGIKTSYWRTLGRDVLLEQRLLSDIIRHSLSIETDEP